jgi:hypothetical protein
VTATITHTILADTGPATVEAQPATPGLYVYQVPDSVDVDAPCRWRLGHHSGLAVARFETAEDALAGAAAVADWTDWTASADAIREAGPTRDDSERRAILWAIEDAGGHLGNCSICD